MCSRPRRAFTLIEVLVVVAIIALLIAILLPSLNAAREQARVVVCKTRLTELFRGYTYYAQDNKHHFPDRDWWLWDNNPANNSHAQINFFPGLYAKTGGIRPTDSSRWVEFGHIYKYVKDKEVYFCPKDNKERAGDSIGSGTNGHKPIHSFVRFVEPTDLYHNHVGATADAIQVSSGTLNRSDFLDPDQLKPGVFGSLHGVVLNSTPNRTGLLYEEYQYFGEPPGGVTSNGYSALNDGYSGFLDYVDWMSMRHNYRSDILFWDGHVALIDALKFNKNQDTYGAYIAIGGTKNY